MKKVLFICLHNPFKTDSGAQQRTNLLFYALMEIGHVDVVCFSDDQAPSNFTADNFTIQYYGKQEVKSKSRIKIWVHLLNIFNPYLVFRKNLLFESVIKKLIEQNNYQYIVSRYVESVFKAGLFHRNDIIVDVDDLPEQYFLSFYRDENLPVRKRIKNLYFAIHSRYFVNSFLQRTKHAFFPNKTQVKYPHSSFLPNIPYPRILSSDTKAADQPQQSVLFVGVLDYPPNQNGIDHFLTHIWSNVIREIPDASLTIVGRLKSNVFKTKWERIKGVVIKGFVDDIEKEYQNCNVVVVPIYHGAGSNIKVLEAMYMKKSSVISRFATRGFDEILTNEKNTMIADNDQEFANAIIRLLKDDELNETIRNNAFQTMKNYFSKEVFFKKVHDVIK